MSAYDVCLVMSTVCVCECETIDQPCGGSAKVRVCQWVTHGRRRLRHRQGGAVCCSMVQCVAVWCSGVQVSFLHVVGLSCRRLLRSHCGRNLDRNSSPQRKTRKCKEATQQIPHLLFLPSPPLLPPPSPSTPPPPRHGKTAGAQQTPYPDHARSLKENGREKPCTHRPTHMWSAD